MPIIIFPTHDIPNLRNQNPAHQFVRNADDNHRPKWLIWNFVGIDLLHTGLDGLIKRFGKPDRRDCNSSVQAKWQDSRSGSILECRIDRESDSIVWIRIYHALPLTGGQTSSLGSEIVSPGISLGVVQNYVLAILRNPTSIVKNKSGRRDFIYAKQMEKNGGEPSFRSRYVFENGKLTQVAVSIGDN
ncbi:MAG: hypothetical protein ABJA67_09580 [Chthonomonadales bacterium]